MPAEVGVEPDPRLARTDMAVDFMNQAMPHFPLMHEMTTEHVHEEIQLLFNDFSSMLHGDARPRPGLARPLPRARPDAALRAPAAAAAGAPAPARRPALAAQVAAAPRAAAGPRAGLPRRSPSSSPTATRCRSPLVDAGDALLHRAHAPLARRPATRSVDYWVDRLDLMLPVAAPRPRRDPGRARRMDVRFDDFMADDLAVGRAGLRARRRGAHRRGRRRHDGVPRRPPARPARHASRPSAEMFGLDEADLRARFAPYVERFLRVDN